MCRRTPSSTHPGPEENDQLTELLAHLHTGAAAFEPASPMPDVGASTSHLRDAPSAERKVKVMPVVIACAVCAISDLSFSMLVPFFPEAAERHGCTPTVTGMLFGLHQAVALLVTPVAPFLCQRFGGAGVLRAACFLQARPQHFHSPSPTRRPRRPPLWSRALRFALCRVWLRGSRRWPPSDC